MATPPVPDSSYEVARSNLETLDTYLNATSGVAINREGLALTPIPQVANQLNTLVSSTAWLPLTGTFTTGATLTERNHILLNPANSQYYSWGGTLPKVVPASSTPTSTGGIALNVWVLRQTDASLRSELGTAAFRNAMISNTDITTPSALMSRGAFGIGGMDSYAGDFNGAPEGWVIALSTTLNNPFSAACFLYTKKGFSQTGRITQEAIRFSDNVKARRSFNASSWSTWATGWESLNVNYLQNTSGASVNPNTNVAGSALTPAQAGTWKCWASTAVANNGYCIWNRVA